LPKLYEVKESKILQMRRQRIAFAKAAEEEAEKKR